MPPPKTLTADIKASGGEDLGDEEEELDLEDLLGDLDLYLVGDLNPNLLGDLDLDLEGESDAKWLGGASYHISFLPTGLLLVVLRFLRCRGSRPYAEVPIVEEGQNQVLFGSKRDLSHWSFLRRNREHLRQRTWFAGRGCGLGVITNATNTTIGVIFFVTKCDAVGGYFGWCFEGDGSLTDFDESSNLVHATQFSSHICDARWGVVMHAS